MRSLRLALGGLLATSPLLGLSQTASPYPRYYVGVAAYASNYQPFRSSYLGLQLPVQATVGYQLRPRLAVQASVAYSSNARSYFGVNKYYTGSAAAASPYAYYEFSGTDTQHSTQVDLMARYTLTRQAAHRFQVDLLGGLSLLRRRFISASTRTDIDSTQTIKVTTVGAANDAYHDLLVTAGVSTRYRFGQHLEAVLDITFDQRLTNGNTFGSFGNATALGLRYRFGGLR